jgi:hypothetical protein
MRWLHSARHVLVVLEAEVGFVMAILGLSGCVLIPLRDRVRSHPEAWLALFAGVLLYAVVHDMIDALSAERAVGSLYGRALSLGLIVVGMALGAAAISTFLKRPPASEAGWRPALLALGLVLALHAAVDGFVVGEALRFLAPTDILQPDTVSLQVVHRFLEGGILVAVMLYSGVRNLRIFAAVFYVSLPMAVTSPLVTVAPSLSATAISILLAFMEAGAFLVLFLQALWPATVERGRPLTSIGWLVAGFLIALLAHALAH